MPHKKTRHQHARTLAISSATVACPDRRAKSTLSMPLGRGGTKPGHLLDDFVERLATTPSRAARLDLGRLDDFVERAGVLRLILRLAQRRLRLGLHHRALGAVSVEIYCMQGCVCACVCVCVCVCMCVCT